jgi:ribose transport system permease protein
MMKNERIETSLQTPITLLLHRPFGLSLNRLLMLVVFVVLFTFFSIFANNFFTVRSVLNLLIQASTLIITSIGATLVLIVGGIDFSIGAEIALAGALVFIFAGFGMPVWLSMILAILSSGLVGIVNGFLVARMRLQSFITTIAMATLIYGALGGFGAIIGAIIAFTKWPFFPSEELGVLANTPIFVIVSHDAAGVPVEIFPGLSWIVIIMVLVAVLFHLVLMKTRIGRNLYLVGSNPVASRLSGIKVIRVRILAFSLAGLLAGLSGVLLASRLVGPPGGAAGYEVLGVACAMIGGASLLGGSGGIGGTMIGGLLLSTISMGLTMMNTNSPYIFIFLNGLVILGSVYLEHSRKRQSLT